MNARRRRRSRPEPTRRAVAAAAALTAAVGLASVLWSVPAVRTVLLQSFTRQRAPFTELYFTGAPSFDGATVLVPIAVNAHGTGVSSYRVRIALDGAAGRTVASTTVRLTARDGVPTPVPVRLRSTADVAEVQVSLLGHPQTLHYSFGPSKTTAQ